MNTSAKVMEEASDALSKLHFALTRAHTHTFTLSIMIQKYRLNILF